jgi:hypothetical protein
MSLPKLVVATAHAAPMLVAMCSSAEPTDAPDPVVPSYTCDHAFDAGCRWSADVSLTGGILTEATIDTVGPLATGASVEALTGTVTVSDGDDAFAPVTCDFTVDLSLATVEDGADTLVERVGTPVFDDACPLACGWFLPPSGTFANDDGRFRMLMVEGRWELELGDFATPDAAPNGPLWWWTEPTSSTFADGVMALDAPVAIAGGGWTAPMAMADPSGAVASCP